MTTYTVIPLVQISSNCWKNCGWVRKKQTNSFFAKRMNKWGTCHRIRAIHYVINYFISFDIKLFPLVEPHWFYVLYKYFAIMHFTFFFGTISYYPAGLANLLPKQQMTISTTDWLDLWFVHYLRSRLNWCCEFWVSFRWSWT